MRDQTVLPKVGDKLTARQAMELAIDMAKNGFGFVAPNPPVGCVLLDPSGGFVSAGFHKACGQDHAEIDALNNIKDRELLKGAHLYVTLEPCAHQGRTPSCAQHLAQLPLQSVTYGMEDPNPLVAGQGVKIIQNAGISIHDFTELSASLMKLMEIYLYNIHNRLPFVALKIATTLDGMIATKNHKGRWITGAQSLEQAHYLRGCYDALLIGRKTLELDDPSLNVRHPLFKNKTNKVIILDPHGASLHKLEKSSLYATHKTHEIFIVIKDKSLTEGLDCSTIEIKTEHHIPIDELLKELFHRGITSIMVEGGGDTITSFLRTGLFQRLHLFQAPKILGGKNGLGWSENFLTDHLDEALCLSHLTCQILGEDLYITGVKS